MRFQSALAALILILGAQALSIAPAEASTILYDSAGFIEGQQSFTESFDITTPGVLTITLTDIPWLDTLADLTCFLTTTKGSIGSPMGTGSESIDVGPGMIYAHWFGIADGSFGVGVYGIKFTFQPSMVTPVPLPGSLLLLLSAIGALFGWQNGRSRRGESHA